MDPGKTFMGGIFFKKHSMPRMCLGWKGLDARSREGLEPATMDSCLGRLSCKKSILTGYNGRMFEHGIISFVR